MQPGKHPNTVAWSPSVENTAENLWIDDDNGHIVDSDNARIIIGDYIGSNTIAGTHIPPVTWNPLA